MENIDKEFTILENIYHTQAKVRQRDLAHIAGISLGMTNAILKRLLVKGFLVTKKISHRTIHYAVTPSGIKEIMKRSYGYFKRTIKNIVVYRKKIEDLIMDIKAKGYRKIILVGKSDLDFIVEHCAREEGLSMVMQIERYRTLIAEGGCFYLISENITQSLDFDSPVCIYLHEYFFR